MISVVDFLHDLTNPSLVFLPKALLVSMLAATICGLVGVHVVVRGMAFIGDAVAHAVFPGIAIAFVTGGSFLLGGAIAGVTVALSVAVLSSNRRVKEDSLIGILLAAAFAVGLVVISRVNGYTASLQSFLFGSLTGVTRGDIYAVAITAAVVAAIVIVCHHRIVTVSLDRESAQALGIRVMAIDLLLYGCVAAAVVISVQTIGNILVLALLITPAATARLISNNITTMLVISPIIGAVGSAVGIYLAWSWDVPTGAAVVLTVAAVFLMVWAGAAVTGALISGPLSRTVAARRRAATTTDPAAASPTGTATTMGPGTHISTDTNTDPVVTTAHSTEVPR